MRHGWRDLDELGESGDPRTLGRPRYERDWIPTFSLVVGLLIVLALLLDTTVAVLWILDRIGGR